MAGGRRRSRVTRRTGRDVQSKGGDGLDFEQEWYEAIDDQQA
jgi:hypothetical protein